MAVSQRTAIAILTSLSLEESFLVFSSSESDSNFLLAAFFFAFSSSFLDCGFESDFRFFCLDLPSASESSLSETSFFDLFDFGSASDSGEVLLAFFCH